MLAVGRVRVKTTDGKTQTPKVAETFGACCWIA